MTQRPETLGQRIRRTRRSLFMTQVELARACNVTQSAVGQWERDETVPALRVRTALAGALRTYPHDLFADVEAVPA